MSSSSFRRPDFRLHLSYPEVTLLRSDIPGMTRLAAPDHPAFADDLRRLAAAIDTSNGRLTVILPDREVWRGRPRLTARVPWARRGEARSIAAQALGVPPGDVALSMGRRGSDGTVPLAATRRQTLVEVRRMLAAVGLKPQVIRGAGRFDGFTTPPALGRLRWHPAGQPLASRFPHVAMAAGSLAATIAAVAALLGGSGPGQIVSPGPLVHQSVARQSISVADAPPPAHAPRPAATALASAAPPLDRPRSAPSDAGSPALVTVNTRNIDLATDKDGQLVLKLHALPDARAKAPEGGLNPMPRPGAVSEAASDPSSPRVVPIRSSRPLPRPLAEAEPDAVEQVVRRVAAVDTEDFGRPEHRPAGKPVEIASLTPAIATIGALAAASAIEPLARPAGLAPIPVPKAAVSTAPAPKPVAAKPSPKLQRGATAGAVAARPVPQAMVRPVDTKPATTRPTVTASVAPQPKIVPITPTPKITRTAAAAKPETTRTTERKLVAAAPRAGLSRSQLSLIGVFGDTDAPHALVRLPNGDIQRVRTGDRIAGLQVASVSASGVRVRNGTSEAVLRLPD